MKEVDIAKCKFAADIVPYMYAELPASETPAFESHLPDCESCTDEFALISSARYEVYDWKKLEFDPLPTPRFVIPSEEPLLVESLTNRIRAAFASTWAIPATGFAALAVIAIFAAAMIVSDDRAVEVASNTNVQPPSVVIPSLPDPAVPDVAEKKSTTPDRAVVATAASKPSPSQHQVGRRPALRENRPDRMIEARTTAVQKQEEKAPTLNEFGDDEDNSLRLAELFEDIDTSD
jgi:hypothetical protein